MRRSFSQLVGRIKEACQRHRYEYQLLGYVGPYKEFELSRVITPETYEKTVAVIAGVHGDEPAPIEAAVQFLEEGIVSEGVRILLYPCLNPWGYVHNNRRNHAGKDLNRTRSLQLEPEQSLFFISLLNERLDFFLSMHEDWWSNKVYAFAFGEQHSDLYSRILSAAGKHMPLHKGNTIDGIEARNGLVMDQSDSSLEDIVSRTGIPSMCSETGKRAEFEQRVNANKAMISVFLDKKGIVIS
ncbi:MAG: succinylglutamate desuccinylase/aspartoacylase family protein [Candidatus Peregrinibacteria bacterium]